MKKTVLLAILCCVPIVVGSSVRAQRAASPTPNAAYPDSPARANPRAGAGNHTIPPDDGRRGPRGPLDWERTEALSPDGRWFVTANLDGQLRVWDALSGKSEVTLPAGASATVFSPDSRLIAVRFDQTADGAAGRYWRVLNTADGKPAGEPFGTGGVYGDAPETVVFAPDGKRLAGFTGDGVNLRIEWWNADDGRVMAVQPVKELLAGGGLAFSSDGKILAAVGAGTAVTLLDLQSLKTLKLIPCSQKSLGAVTFSPDGKLLAVGGNEQRIARGRQDGYPAATLYETATGRVVADLRVIPSAGARVRQIVFADGGRAVVTATDVSAQAWSSVDGRLQANLPGGAFPLAVSADGRTLAGSQSPDLACWDTAAWHLGMKIVNARAGYGAGTGPWGSVPLAFTPDGSGIVTLRRNSAAAWELPSGRPLGEWNATQSRAVR